MRRKPSHCILSALALIALLTTSQADAKTLSELKGRAPQPLLANQLILVQLIYRRGAVELTRMSRHALPRARRFRRFVGRYQIRLFRNKTLLEIANFNFPLTAKIELQNKKEQSARQQLMQSLLTHTTVQVPSVPSATHMLLVYPDPKRKPRWLNIPPLTLAKHKAKRGSVVKKR